jgi:hypothetical protein
MKNKKIPLLIYVTPDVHRVIETIARKNNRPMTYIGEQLIQRGLEEKNDSGDKFDEKI